MSVTFYPNYIMYAGFDAAAEPSVSGQVATMSGGETTGPLYDLVDNNRETTLSLDTSGETTAADINITMTSNIDFDYIILDNHNLKSADAKVRILIDYNGTPLAATTLGAYSGTLGEALVAEDVTSNYAIIDNSDGIALISAAGDDNDIAVQIDDVSTFDADVTLGEIVICDSFTPAISPELNQSFKYMYKTSGFVESLGGKKYGFARDTTPQKQWRLTWKVISDSDKALFMTVFDVTCGSKFPFYIDLGEAATPQLYRVRFLENSLNMTQLTKDAWSLGITIEEEL